MVRLSKKAKAQDVAVQQDATVADTPAQDVAVQQDTPVAPVEATAPVETAPVVVKAKPARYAPASSFNNMAAVITVVVPNAKGPSGKSKASTRFNRFYSNGITVGEFIAAYKAANLSTTLARADLRWDLQHGWISLS